VQSVFGIVVFSVVGISGLIAIGAFLFAGPPHSSIGGGGFAPPAPSSGSEPAEMREDDVRQMLEARNRRRIARGEPGGDVDAELAALLAPEASNAPVSGEVRAEAEAIVTARQSRRRRRGQPEGDFEAEVDELLRTIGAG
jgi:hypothetical protein